MAQITSSVSKSHSFPPEFKAAPVYFNVSSHKALGEHHHSDNYIASNEEIPTIDYSLLLSNDTDQRSITLELLSHACEEYGFFYVSFSIERIQFLSGN